MTSLPGCGRGLTCSEQVRDQSGQRPFQVELQQLDGLQAVRFLFLRRPPTAGLKQGQVLAAPDPGEQLGQTGDIWIPTSQHVLAVSQTRAVQNVATYLVVAEEADPLHLVEDGVMAGVYLVPPVNVSGQQEGVQSGPHQLPLVGGGVSAQHRSPAHRCDIRLFFGVMSGALWAASGVPHLFK